MRRGVVRLVLAASVLACVEDGITYTDRVNGIKYTARFAYAGIGWNLIATLENVGTAHQERRYPVACPVRIRLYRPADGFRMYDETRLPCVSDTATLSLGAGDKHELSSGIRTPGYMLGDSLAYQTYAVRGVVQTEGENEIEVVAGPWIFGQAPPGAALRRR